MSRGGWILAQVLVMALLLGLIASQILKLVLQPALSTHRLAANAAQTGQAQAAINKVQAAWTANAATCTSGPSLGIRCSGRGCRCSCALDSVPGVAVESSGPAVGPCTLSATTADSP